MSADTGWLLLAAYSAFLTVWALVDHWRNRHTYRAQDRRYFLQRDEE